MNLQVRAGAALLAVMMVIASCGTDPVEPVNTSDSGTIETPTEVAEDNQADTEPANDASEPTTNAVTVAVPDEQLWDQLVGPVWQVDSFTLDGATIQAVDMTLEFGDLGRADGLQAWEWWTGCNNIEGNFYIDGATVTFGNNVVEEAECGQEQGRLQDGLVEVVFGGEPTLSVDGNRLTFAYDSGNELVAVHAD